MSCFEFEGPHPTVHPEAFVAPTATLMGEVTSVLHAAPGHTVVIGKPAQRHRAGALVVEP